MRYISRQGQNWRRLSESTEKQLKELSIPAGESALREYQFDILQDMIQRIGSEMDTMKPEQRRMAIRLILQKVVWDGENVNLYFLPDTESDNQENGQKKRALNAFDLQKDCKRMQ